MIAIIDYGMGNIHSVKKALELYGAQVRATNKAVEIVSAEKIVLPGVGAFDDAMLELQRLGLNSVIKEEIKAGKPFLGICLGMQLLFEKSAEASKCKGLGIFKGEVKKFSGSSQKVPHMGWNQLKNINPACLLLKDIAEGSAVYFCHSYYPQPQEKSINAGLCDYEVEFSAALWQNNVFGVQFHPEKSQAVGLKMLENFVKIC
jgi:glutamine amidotransferase